METNQKNRDNVQNESDWETEEEDYIRLKIENISQIKQKINTFGKNKLMKVKKMDKENYKRISKCNEFLNDSIYSNIRILQPPKFKWDDYEAMKNKQQGNNLQQQCESNFFWVKTNID